jgi:hypothetical protein
MLHAKRVQPFVYSRIISLLLINFQLKWYRLSELERQHHREKGVTLIQIQCGMLKSEG